MLNVLGKQGTAVPTRAFWPAPAEAEADQKLVRATSLKPFNADESAATHRSDAITSMTVIRGHALFLYAVLSLRDLAALRNLPYELKGREAHP